MILFLSTTTFALIVALGMTALLVTCFYHFVILRCPFVPTSRVVCRKMVELARLTGTERVYDLGAGDGAVLIEAVRLFPKLRVTGIERVISVRWIGKLRMWYMGTHVDLRGGDFYKMKVSDADAIFLYLLPHLMVRLEEKFNRELRPGTVVVSHAFRFPGRRDREEMVQEGNTRLYRYVW